MQKNNYFYNVNVKVKVIIKNLFLGSKSRMFFLYEKESLLRDNDISFKTGWESCD